MKIAFALLALALWSVATQGLSREHAYPHGADYYANSSGHLVHRPVHVSRAPAGATARCRDGTFSFSEHHRGTCSYHGGVAQWL